MYPGIWVIERTKAKLSPTLNMTPRKLFILGIALATVITNIAFAETNHLASSETDYTVALRFGKQTPLTQEAAQNLYSKALEFLGTSNFNSRAGDISKFHEQYRETVAGKYLLISLKAPRKISTIGGEVIVKEIVIGLNRPDCIAIVGAVSYTEYASSLFTIDDEGRVVVHRKYSGPMCIELMKLVKTIAGDA